VTTGAAANNYAITLPLEGIVSRLPDSFLGVLKQPPGPDANVTLPLRKVIEQLPRGVVRIPFGEVRSASTPGVFLDFSGYDLLPVEVPLQDVINRLNPAFLTKRADQTAIEIPESISSPFDPRSQSASVAPPQTPGSAWAGSTHSRLPSTSPTATPPPASGPAPSGPSPALHQRPKPTPLSVHPPSTSSPFYQPPVSRTTSPAPRPMASAPAAPIMETPAAGEAAPMQGRTGPAAVRRTPDPAPSGPSAPAAPVAAVPTAAVPAVPTTPTTHTVVVSLAQVMNVWPDGVRQEIMKHGWQSASLELPVAELEEAMRRGRVAFTWKALRVLLPQTAGTTSHFDDTTVELPLPVIIPLVMSAGALTASAKKAAVNTDIPDVFSQTAASPSAPPARPSPARPAPRASQPAPEQRMAGLGGAGPAAPPPEQKPGGDAVSTPGPGASSKLVTLPMAEVVPIPLPPGASAAPSGSTTFQTRPAQSIDQLFGEPGKTTWTPMEIVRKTSQLRGVAGAMICTLDGLLVTGNVPVTVGEETLAAIVPQMFNRMAGYTKELSFGAPGRLSFVAENVTYTLFKSGKVYLTVASHPGDTLPATELNLVADQLGKQCR
jgi:predicted regulator of Ras-like GTPase activity (Roadblock/LC7/MglB family)